MDLDPQVIATEERQKSLSDLVFEQDKTIRSSEFLLESLALEYGPDAYESACCAVCVHVEVQGLEFLQEVTKQLLESSTPQIEEGGLVEKINHQIHNNTEKALSQIIENFSKSRGGSVVLESLANDFSAVLADSDRSATTMTLALNGLNSIARNGFIGLVLNSGVSEHIEQIYDRLEQCRTGYKSALFSLIDHLGETAVHEHKEVLFKMADKGDELGMMESARKLLNQHGLYFRVTKASRALERLKFKLGAGDNPGVAS